MPGRALATNEETDEDYTGHDLDSEGEQLCWLRACTTPAPGTTCRRWGRWNGPDPLADDLGPPKVFVPAWSPYNYSLNSPVNLYDPDGRAPCCLLPTGLAETADGFAALMGNEQAQERVKTRAKTQGAIYGTIASLIIPGPEDAVLAAAAGTKVARAAAKYADEAGDFVRGLFRSSDEATDARRRTSTLYEDITDPGSIPNRRTDITREEFESNLETAGFSRSTSKDGSVLSTGQKSRRGSENL